MEAMSACMAVRLVSHLCLGLSAFLIQAGSLASRLAISCLPLLEVISRCRSFSDLQGSGSQQKMSTASEKGQPGCFSDYARPVCFLMREIEIAVMSICITTF